MRGQRYSNFRFTIPVGRFTVQVAATFYKTPAIVRSTVCNNLLQGKEPGILNPELLNFPPMKKKTLTTLIPILLLTAIAVSTLLKNNKSHNKEQEQPRQEAVKANPESSNDTAGRQPQRQLSRPPSDVPVRDIGFDRLRKGSKLIYTKHARCRMACRHIEESEVQEILEKGVINNRKSEPAARPDPKYALEGRTRDGQQVRIIFAPTARGIVVVTVIDLDKNWTCDCK